jgi:hypothetical protein
MSVYEVKYPWRAYFKDGSTLSQFEPDGSENLFRKVLDRTLDLERFQVGIWPPIATVDLRDGSFLLPNGVRVTGSSRVDGFEEWGVDERLPKRLIYFRRVARQFGAGGGDAPKELGTPYVVYAVGWQATLEYSEVRTATPRNVKHILFIHPDGSLVFA